MPSMLPPETETPAETTQPPIPPRKKARMIWPRGSGLPGFGRYRGTKWYDMETEGQDEHDDSSLPASTSNTRRSIPVPTKDDKSPGSDREQHGDAKMSSEPTSPDPPASDFFDFRPDPSSEGSNPTDYEPMPEERNKDYPQYAIDEFWHDTDYTQAYVRYRIAGGRLKFKESDTGSEEYYTRFPGIEFDEIGDWWEDYNNVPPDEWSMSDKEYVKWFLSTHPKPVDLRQATRFWLDRREMLWRRQHPTPGSYEEFLASSRIRPGDKYEDGYDYISHPEDTWDKGKLYRMYMIRLKAAIDLQQSTDEIAYITEQEIDNYLIANHEPEKGEEDATLAARQ